VERIQCLLVGCGVMGGALKQGWERTKVPCEVTVIDPSNTQYFHDICLLPEGYVPDVVLFAVKPQVLPQILPSYQRFAGRACLFISVAAGIPLHTYHSVLGAEEAIIRAMPNLPATVGQGMSVLVAQRLLSERHQSLGQALFEACGKVVWLDKESLMDAVTAVSGSGPAYFFRMVECLAAAGIKAGLPPDVSNCLAHQTAIGAGAMLQQSSDTVGNLRARVTSPGGTTAAALGVFDEGGALEKLVLAAVRAAIHRGQELSQ